MKIYMHETGPLVTYDGAMLRIEDLNPEVKTKWRMTRWEMVRFSLAALWSAIWVLP